MFLVNEQQRLFWRGHFGKYNLGVPALVTHILHPTFILVPKYGKQLFFWKILFLPIFSAIIFYGTCTCSNKSQLSDKGIPVAYYYASFSGKNQHLIEVIAQNTHIIVMYSQVKALWPQGTNYDIIRYYQQC